jgi:hypothetical protein
MAGIPIITGFDLSAAAPIDSRYVAADTASREAIFWKYAGLLVYQVDNETYYYYDGANWTAVLAAGTPGAPGSVWYFDTAAPDPGDGVNGDYFLNTTTGDVYNKAAGVWNLIGNLMGPQGPEGTVADYASIYVTGGATPQSIPTTDTLVNQFVSDGPSFNAVPNAAANNITLVEAGVYALFFNATVVGILTKAYQVTVYADGVAVTTAVGLIDCTIDTKQNVGFYTVVNIVDPGVVLELFVKSTTGTTENLTFVTGSWGVQKVNAKGNAGKALIHTEPDIIFNEAKITSVEAGTWTPENPYSASIAADNRLNLAVPASISGNKVGHSLAYDGVDWYDNGVWRGPTGAPGTPGTPGAPGPPGTNYFQLILFNPLDNLSVSAEASTSRSFAAFFNPSGINNTWLNNTGQTVQVLIEVEARWNDSSNPSVVQLLLTTSLNGSFAGSRSSSNNSIASPTSSSVSTNYILQVPPGQTLGFRASISLVTGSAPWNVSDQAVWKVYIVA